MKDRPQKKVSPIWHSDIPGILLILFGPAVIGILAAMLLPALYHLKHADAWGLFGAGLVVGVVGLVFLFLARLPLYRQRQFFAVGPRLLDTTHRRLYWLAYGLVAVSVFLLLGLLVRLQT